MQQGPSRIPGEQPDAGTSPLGLPEALREGNLRKAGGSGSSITAGRADAPGQAPPVWLTPRPSRRPPSGRHRPEAKKLFDGRPARRYFCSPGAGRGEGVPQGPRLLSSKRRGAQEEPTRQPPRRGWPSDQEVLGWGWDKGQGQGPRRREATPLILAASHRRLSEDAALSPSPPPQLQLQPPAARPPWTCFGHRFVPRGWQTCPDCGYPLCNHRWNGASSSEAQRAAEPQAPEARSVALSVQSLLKHFQTHLLWV